MKKLLAMLLAIVLTLSLVSVMALAEGEQPKYVIDGVKDAAYTDRKCLTSDCWEFYDNDSHGTVEPVDYERLLHTLWFDWDDTHVYIYFQAESKDDLYKPAADETSVPDFGEVFYEIAQIYLDTVPSAGWNAPCIWAGENGNGDYCDHMACGCREGADNAYYRLMARANPAFDHWNDYYFTAAGMFMTYEEFCENYTGRAGCEDLAAAYVATHGNDASAVSFIDYETNTYGFEMKFPRAEGEEYFQINVRTRVNETEWEDEGPELPYTLSVCPAWWSNSEGLKEIWFEDYVDDISPEVAAIVRQMAELPSVDMLTLEHKDAVIAILNQFNDLTEEQMAEFTEEQLTWLSDAAVKISILMYVAALGDVNQDGNINATDALIVLRASVGKVELGQKEMAAADVNGDEKIDAKDALEILQFTVGKRDEFSVVKTLEME